MGACLSKVESDTAAPPWPELLPEIAGLLLHRLPDHRDRLSFGAVCHEWRLAARQQGLPPAMPYVSLGDGTYLSLAGGIVKARRRLSTPKAYRAGNVRRFPIPMGYSVGASFDGGWFFCYHEATRRCFLRRPLSHDAIEVPTRCRRPLVKFLTATTWALERKPYMMVLGRCMEMKMVVCSSRLVVALFRRHPRDYYLASFRPAQLQQRQPVSVWSFIVQPDDNPYPDYVYTDIAFYDGKLFALSCSEHLFCHNVDDVMNHQQHQPIVEHETQPTMSHTNCYLVVSSDKKKLLMVRWRRNQHDDGHPIMDLWVFEANFDTGRWLEVKDLGGQVLFLSKNCSNSFPAGSTEHWGPRFRGGNRVFVLGSEWARSSRWPISCKDIPIYSVYDMMSGKTTMVSLNGPSYLSNCTLGWFFPTS